MHTMTKDDRTELAIAGFDPGLDGSMAILWTGEPVVVPYDRALYIQTLRDFQCKGFKVVAAVEHVGGIPGQSAPAAFNFGAVTGFLHGVLETLRIPYELVRPQKWKKEFSCTSDKNTSIEVAKRLFPGVNLRRTERCKKDHDGMSEALLLAEYMRRHFHG